MVNRKETGNILGIFFNIINALKISGWYVSEFCLYSSNEFRNV